MAQETNMFLYLIRDVPKREVGALRIFLEIIIVHKMIHTDRSIISHLKPIKIDGLRGVWQFGPQYTTQTDHRINYCLVRI